MGFHSMCSLRFLRLMRSEVGVKPQRTQGTQKILSVGVLPSSTYKILAITCDPPVEQCSGSEIARAFVFLCVLATFA